LTLEEVAADCRLSVPQCREVMAAHGIDLAGSPPCRGRHAVPEWDEDEAPALPLPLVADDLQQVIARVLRARGPQTPADLVGWTGRAWAAVRAALEHPYFERDGPRVRLSARAMAELFDR